MSAITLLAQVRALGARIEVHGDRLRIVAPSGAIDETLRAKLADRKVELLDLLRAQPHEEQRDAGVNEPADLLDGHIHLAVFHSRALGRDFVLARDAAALEFIAKSDRNLPVLTFADCEKLAGLKAADVAAILDVREAFGPAAELVAVRPHVG